MPQKCMECFRLLLEHLAWFEHQFLSVTRDSRKAGSLCGMMRGVGGVRKSMHQSWLAKELGLGLLCWGFKGVQEEIPPSEEASTLQIGSVAFPPGQCTSSQFHPWNLFLWKNSFYKINKLPQIWSSGLDFFLYDKELLLSATYCTAYTRECQDLLLNYWLLLTENGVSQIK